MEKIIPPVDKKLIEAELTEDILVRKTNNGGNLLYIFSAHEAPNLMREVARLREESFRYANGGTGHEMDIDNFDTCENPYKQLIVWDPDHREILGGYRFKICDEDTIDENGVVHLSTAELFNFTDKFCKEYLPHMIELGRSFVVPAYQSSSRLRKGMYALDNLWDGLGAIVVDNPEKKYFFGKVTMYTSYNVQARNYVLYFLERYFADREKLVTPIVPLETNMDREHLAKVFENHVYKEDYKILSKEVRNLGEMIPPLINSYMNLSPTMKFYGTAINNHFGGVEESAIMVTIKDIYQAKVERHIRTYIPFPRWLKKIRRPKIRILSKLRRHERE
jgi:hypothetical protein